jgi:hypothetical protein
MGKLKISNRPTKKIKIMNTIKTVYAKILITCINITFSLFTVVLLINVINLIY